MCLVPEGSSSFANPTRFSVLASIGDRWAMSLNFSAGRDGGRRMVACDLDGTYIFELTGRVDCAAASHDATRPRRNHSAHRWHAIETHEIRPPPLLSPLIP